MGETKEPTQGTPQPTGQPPGSEGRITSEGEPQTYNEEQAQKRVSDALAAAGRDAKALEQRETALKAREDGLQARESKISDWQKARDAEELEAAQGNPQLLDAFQQKRTLAADRAKVESDRQELDRDKEAHQGQIDAANATQWEITIWEIAQRNTVDAATLKDKCDKFNLQSTEQMEEMAKTMAAGKPAVPPIIPDSLITTGGREDLSGMSSRKAFSSYLSDKK